MKNVTLLTTHFLNLLPLFNGLTDPLLFFKKNVWLKLIWLSTYKRFLINPRFKYYKTFFLFTKKRKLTLKSYLVYNNFKKIIMTRCTVFPFFYYKLFSAYPPLFLLPSSLISSIFYPNIRYRKKLFTFLNKTWFKKNLLNL